jgi:catechol 2,3-dioxygenase-like lactoylglutathione lyase family enzyme
MLAHADAVANVAVRDLDAARRFYESTLGLTWLSAEGDLVVYQSGKTALNVYRSQYAGTNQATAVTWSVGEDLDAVMNDLRAKGVKFEHYDLPGSRREGDVHVYGPMKVAWFKDPDGNLLNVTNR